MAKKHYTDRERMEIVKKFRASGLPINRYARENGIVYSSLRDWAYARRKFADIVKGMPRNARPRSVAFAAMSEMDLEIR